ncbi:putative reverse transcriptase domain-containing protein [Tanacetum coccineum]
MFMTIQSSVKDKILATPSETSKVENAPAEMLRDLDQQMEKRVDDGKANVVTDALSRKERVKPRRVRAMAITIQYGVRGMILEAQSDAFKQENVLAKRLHGTVIMDEAYKFKYSVHPGFISWRSKNGDHGTYMGIILAIREDYSTKRLAKIYIDEIVARHGVPVFIISDRDGWFTSRCWQTVQKALGTRLDMSTAYHPQTDGQSERTIQTLEDMLRECVIDFGGSWDVYLPLAKFSYNNSYHSSIRCAPFEALYGRKCRSPVLLAEIGESSLFGPELVQEMTDEVVLIKEKPKEAIECQKSYVDNRRKPLEFEEGDQVLLKVSPWKGVVHFGKKGKLALRYIGPFEILEKIGPVAYRLRLPKELSGEHDTFHVSNLKNCLADASLHVPLDEIKVDKTLCFVEEPVEIMDREVKSLKHSRILLVKVHRNSKRSPEFTWEREDHMKSNFLLESFGKLSKDYLNRAQEFVDALAAISEPVKDKDLVILVVSGLREEYNGLKTTITSRQSPTAFSELHALLSDHDYMHGKIHAPAPSITSSFAANYVVGSPSMPKAHHAQLSELTAQLSALGFQV